MKDNPKGQGIRKSLLVLLSLFLLPGVHALVDQAGWPKDIGGMVVSSPALADLDGDGDFEVIIGADDGTVYAWHGDGSNAAGWPKSMGYDVLSSPAVGDLDGDGDLDAFVGNSWSSANKVWLNDGQGNFSDSGQSLGSSSSESVALGWADEKRSSGCP